MSTVLPAVARARAQFSAASGRRAGAVTGLVLGSYLWATGVFPFLPALVLGLVPVLFGGVLARLGERCRRASREGESALPLALGGAFSGGLFGLLFVFLWVAAASATGIPVPDFLRTLMGFDRFLFLLHSGVLVGASAGALGGVGIAAARRHRDPVGRALRAGLGAALATGLAAGTGLLSALGGWSLGMLGILGPTEVALLGPSMGAGLWLLGPLGLALVTGAAAGGVSLGLGAADAWEDRVERERFLPQTDFMKITSSQGLDGVGRAA